MEQCLALDILAGTISSIIFATGTLTMVAKMVRTQEVDSYSFWSLVLNNIGNLLYWVYVMSLPLGPIHFLHGFYTIATLIMLVCYLVWHTCVKNGQAEAASNAAPTTL